MSCLSMAPCAKKRKKRIINLIEKVNQGDYAYPIWIPDAFMEWTQSKALLLCLHIIILLFVNDFIHSIGRIYS